MENNNKNGIYVVMQKDGFDIDGSQSIITETEYSFFDKGIASEVAEALMTKAHGAPESKERKKLDGWLSPDYFVKKQKTTARTEFPKELEEYRVSKEK